MPTIRSHEGLRVRLYVRGEHKPPHVHVFKGTWEIRVLIGASATYWDTKFGKPTTNEVARAVALVTDCLGECNAKWSELNAHL